MFVDTRPLWRGIAAAILTAKLLLAQMSQADAFGATSLTDNGSFGTCTFFYDLSVSRYKADVGIDGAHVSQFFSVGARYGSAVDKMRTPKVAGNPDFGGGAPITLAAIEPCGFTNVINLTQNGADKT